MFSECTFFTLNADWFFCLCLFDWPDMSDWYRHAGAVFNCIFKEIRICFGFVLLEKLVPLCQPIKCKTKTNSDTLNSSFQGLTQFMWSHVYLVQAMIVIGSLRCLRKLKMTRVISFLWVL